MQIFILFYLIFGIFAFIIIGQIKTDRKRSGERDWVAGSGKVLVSGFELGTPHSATTLYVGVLPARLSAPT